MTFESLNQRLKKQGYFRLLRKFLLIKHNSFKQGDCNMSAQWKEWMKKCAVGLLALVFLGMLMFLVFRSSDLSSVKESLEKIARVFEKDGVAVKVELPNEINVNVRTNPSASPVVDATRSEKSSNMASVTVNLEDGGDPIVQRWDFKKGNPSYLYAVDGGQHIFYGRMCEEGQYITRTKSGVWTFPEYSDTTGEFRGYGSTTLDCYVSHKRYPNVTGTIVQPKRVEVLPTIRPPSASTTQPSEKGGIDLTSLKGWR